MSEAGWPVHYRNVGCFKKFGTNWIVQFVLSQKAIAQSLSWSGVSISSFEFSDQNWERLIWQNKNYRSNWTLT